MVQILSLAAVILSAVAAVQSAAVPIVSLNALEERSPNAANLLVSAPPEAILGRRHYVYDGVKLIRTADPSTDPAAAELHKRSASFMRIYSCKPFGQTICGTCYYHEISYDTAFCVQIEGLQFINFRDMTNASAKLYKDSSDCTGTSYNVAGCRDWTCLQIQQYYTKSVLATVGCTAPA